jgi:hypothetical protein
MRKLIAISVPNPGDRNPISWFSLGFHIYMSVLGQSVLTMLFGNNVHVI